MDLFKVYIDEAYNVIISVSPVLVGLIALVLILLRFYKKRIGGENFEINEAEIGIGKSKIKVRPNYEDMQIAYKLYVELTTRKIGLKIDFDDDFLIEVYNSWYEFFKVTREHIKDIPAHKIRRSKTTRAIVHVAIEVLNEGLRPHLTKWQSRFRSWYERESANEDFAKLNPQDIQKSFPDYEKLISEMESVNNRLIEYRNVMKRLAIGNQ